MNLEEFVSSSIEQIIKGVATAAAAAEKMDARVNPANVVISTVQGVSTTYVNDEYKQFKHVQMIDFDVAVYASEGAGSTAGGGLTVASVLKAGAEKKTESESGSESRIRFSVPVLLPQSGAVPPPRTSKSLGEMQQAARGG